MLVLTAFSYGVYLLRTMAPSRCGLHQASNHVAPSVDSLARKQRAGRADGSHSPRPGRGGNNSESWGSGAGRRRRARLCARDFFGGRVYAFASVIVPAEDAIDQPKLKRFLSRLSASCCTGLTFGAIFAITGQIWVPMIAHHAFDVTAVAIIYWDVESAVAHLVFR